MKPRYVEVRWLDAKLYVEPVPPADLEKTLVLAPRRTRGWLVVDEEDRIAVASTWDDDGEFDGCWVIPKSWVQAIKPLRQPKEVHDAHVR